MRTAVRISETQKRSSRTGQVKAVCSPWTRAKRMLVRMAEKARAGKVIWLVEFHCSRAAGMRGAVQDCGGSVT